MRKLTYLSGMYKITKNCIIQHTKIQHLEFQHIEFQHLEFQHIEFWRELIKEY